jgi:peptide/nickel transport system substrate-binding protein
MLIINCTKAPLKDKTFRRAMSAAINYGDIKELAVSGYSPDLQGGLIMPGALEGKYFVAEDAKKHAAFGGLEVARKMLADAGYKSVWSEDSVLQYMTDKDGNRLPTLGIKSPAGWSDWEAMVTLAVRAMRKAGIDVREDFVDGGKYWPAKPSGDFDLIMDKPSAAITPSLPWSRFEATMSSRNWVACGKGGMNENIGRYNQPGSAEYNPKVDSLLKVIPLTSDSTALKAAYAELNRIFMDDQPVLPLANLPEQFYQFSTRHWTNWPTAKNPYAPPQLPWVSAGTKTLWQLQPVQQAK